MTGQPCRLAQALAARRRTIGLSQVELARRLGVQQSRVSDYETGRTQVPLVFAEERWAAALGCRLELVDVGGVS